MQQSYFSKLPYHIEPLQYNFSKSQFGYGNGFEIVLDKNGVRFRTFLKFLKAMEEKFAGRLKSERRRL
jgi:hypothetical protein